MIDLSLDPDPKKWKLVPNGYRFHCSCCGGTETANFDTVEECINAFIDVGCELRRTGVWCPDCVKDERVRFAAIDAKYSYRG